MAAGKEKVSQVRQGIAQADLWDHADPLAGCLELTEEDIALFAR